MDSVTQYGVDTNNMHLDVNEENNYDNYVDSESKVKDRR